MQGVQPMAKIAPSPNEVIQPPRRLTTRPPRRSSERGAAHRAEGPAEARARVPVVVATEGGRAGLEGTPDPVEDGDVDDGRPGSAP